MKDILSKFLLLVLLLPLTACGARETPSPGPAPAAMAEAILELQPNMADYTVTLTDEDQDYAVYLEGVYGLDPRWVTGGAIRRAEGVLAYEVAVLAASDEKAEEAICGALGEYLESRRAAFYGYAPEQFAVLEKAEILTAEGCVFLVVCADQAIVRDYLAGKPVEIPKQKTEEDRQEGPASDRHDMSVYPTDPIAAAYRSGDTSDLTEKDTAILAVCRQVMEERIQEGMSDYEKELALHDWMILWADYDHGVYEGKGSPDNTNPYGFLTEKKATCLGYATTFQLLLTMADIESLVVTGTSFEDRQEHAWNLVKLEGEWYAVDVTWDDQVAGDPGESYLKDLTMQIRTHRYFNVTSKYLRATEHYWDEETVPEAAATEYAWKIVSE